MAIVAVQVYFRSRLRQTTSSPGMPRPPDSPRDLIAPARYPTRFPTFHRADIDPPNPLIIHHNGTKRRYYGNFAAYPPRTDKRSLARPALLADIMLPASRPARRRVL